MAGAGFNYEDILDPRRQGSDLKFGLQTLKGLPEYKYVKHQSPKEVKERVLQSQRIRHIIEQLAAEQGLEEAAIYAEAESILVEMGHNLNMTNLRCLAVIFAKIFRTLFRHIYVNQNGIQKMKNRMTETPVVLLPTHRSYLDFLLLSYILFHYHVPLPFIAAGADFMHMKFVGEILRLSGAFYIRRSFGSDRLYWALFTEYVQVNLCNSEGPLEFFIEGTRSRSGKFLSPKLGLLSVVIEPFLKGKVPDITLVPVSIGYERIVEEKLHAQELLGIPKPKESTSGLVKARSIFQDDFGSITIHFGDPVSLRDQMTSLDRSVHNLSPRFLFSLTPAEQQAIESTAHAIQHTQRSNLCLSAWVLCAACLMQQQPSPYSLRELAGRVAWLNGVVVQYGAKVDWPVGGDAQGIVKASLRVHHNLVRQHKDGQVTLSKALYGQDCAVNTSTAESVLTHAAVHTNVALYRNYLAACLAPHAMVAVALCGQEKCTTDELYGQFQFLTKLFSEEFTSDQKHSQQTFEGVLGQFRGCSVVDVEGEEVQVTTKGERELAFFSQMMAPFLLGYWLVCRYLMAHPSVPQGVSLKQTAKDIQTKLVSIIAQGKLHHYEVLSLNLLSNALTSLTQMGILIREKSVNGAIISWTRGAVARVADKIDEFIQVPTEVSSFSHTDEVPLAAKL